MSTLRRLRRDNGAVAPATSLDISPQATNQGDDNDYDEWSTIQKFLSAPTTPRIKKKIHFADTAPQDIGPRRTNTAPPGFLPSSSTTFCQDSTPAKVKDDDELQQSDLISFDDPSMEPPKADKKKDGLRLEAFGSDDDFYGMERVMSAVEDNSSTPTEELPRVTPDEEVQPSVDTEEAEPSGFPFKQARSLSTSGAWPSAQERAASSRYHRTSSMPKLNSKPAYTPVIKAQAVVAAPSHVAAYATIADDNNDDDEREVAGLEDVPALSRTRTASSSSSAFSVAWDEKIPDATSEKSGPPSDTPSPSGMGKQQTASGNEHHLETVKRKLSALSRVKGDNNVKATKERSPEQVQSPEDTPAAPSNTRRSSDSPKKGHGGYPARHSRSHNSSPIRTPKIEWSDPQSSASSKLESPPLKPALKQGCLSKQFGALKSGDRFASSHRDSLDLARERMSQKWPMLDPQLSSTRDSIILAKQRFEKYPKSQVIIDESTGQVKFGGLSPIKDASPPDPRAYWAARREQSAQEKETRWKREIGGHPENDEDCPICEIEKPRAKRMREMQAVL